MEPETESQRPDDRAPAIQRNWAKEGYWEDELMQFAVGSSADYEPEQPWQEMDRPLESSEF